MSRNTFFVVLGLLVIVTPFLGLPYGYLMALYPLYGVGIIATAYLRSGRTKSVTPPSYDSSDAT